MNIDSLIITTPDSLRQMLTELLDERLAKIAPAKNDDAPLDKKSLAKYLGVSISTLEKIMKSGEIQYFNIGNQPRFTWTQIETYVNKKVSK